jgi:methyltransferase (TIGR00027 family)
MIDKYASRTALSVSWLRAAHQVLDSPLILEDSASLALHGDGARAQIFDRIDELETRGARALRAHVALRSRFAEDRLSLAVDRGVTQYVILGAGYDTFGVRQPAWARRLRITEMDQAVTQGDKKKRLNDAGLLVPENVEFLPVDFETETLEEAFLRSDLDPLAPTFFSWLGVTVYLTEPAIDAVFSCISKYAKGSEIVFTFAQPRRESDDLEIREGSARLARQSAAVGEPWQTYFTLESLEIKLTNFGYSEIRFLTPSESEEKYFAGRSDGFTAPHRTSIASATI